MLEQWIEQNLLEDSFRLRTAGNRSEVIKRRSRIIGGAFIKQAAEQIADPRIFDRRKWAYVHGCPTIESGLCIFTLSGCGLGSPRKGWLKIGSIARSASCLAIQYDVNAVCGPDQKVQSQQTDKQSID